jgi:hypothetical protein
VSVARLGNAPRVGLGDVFRRAVSDLYGFSWRLVIVNTAVSVVCAIVVVTVSAVPLSLLLAPIAAGPVVAGLVHCTVKVIREGEFVLADAADGVRRHWRQGLQFGALCGAAIMLGALAVAFYGSERHRVLPLAVLAVYLVAFFLLVLLRATPIAIGQPETSVTEALTGAFMLVVRAPLRYLALGTGLLVVNLLGALTVLPLLTLTIAYSFLVAGRVVLPRTVEEEEVIA